MKVKSLHPAEDYAKVALQLYQALMEPGAPKDGLCGNDGVGQGLGNDLISISRVKEDGKFYLLVMIFRSRELYVDKNLPHPEPIGYSDRIHLERGKAVAEALGFRLKSKVYGWDGAPGVSLVFDAPCPRALKTAILNYETLDNLFDRKSNQKRYQAFDYWFSNSMNKIKEKEKRS